MIDQDDVFALGEGYISSGDVRLPHNSLKSCSSSLAWLISLCRKTKVPGRLFVYQGQCFAVRFLCIMFMKKVWNNCKINNNNKPLSRKSSTVCCLYSLVVNLISTSTVHVQLFLMSQLFLQAARWKDLLDYLLSVFITFTSSDKLWLIC